MPVPDEAMTGTAWAGAGDRWTPTVLRTARLILEPLRVDHAELMVLLLSDPRLYEFTGGRPPKLDELRARYRRQVVGRSADGRRLWLNWIGRARKGGAPIGFVQATVTPSAPMRAELAWLIGADHQHQGLAREATRAMVAWLEDRGVEGLTARIRADHRASQAVAAGIGLVSTGVVDAGEVIWANVAQTDPGGAAGAS